MSLKMVLVGFVLMATATVIFFSLSPLYAFGLGHDINLKDTIVYGPGLHANPVLPVRYIYIIAVGTDGQNMTTSIGDKAFNIFIYEKDGTTARIWTQLLDRRDGSYIVMYKLYEDYEDLTLQLMYNGKHVADSPYKLKGLMHHENCYCPLQHSEWVKAAQCPKGYAQIKNDLSIFHQIDMNKESEEILSRFRSRGAHSLCHYVIKDNKIYRKTHGQHVDFKMFIDAMLLSLTRKMRLPDLEFFINLGDWPLASKNGAKLPIFSWCGSDDSWDIVLPTYDVTESTLETMGRVSLELLSVQANTGPPWQNKSSMAFWRGRDSRQERLDLVKLSRKHPDVIDAKLTNMFFFPRDEEQYGKIVPHISFYDFFKHKYQISLDGTVAAYRFPYLLAGDSVILKQNSPYYEHFYKRLKPYQHYIPVKRDLSDLLEQLQWAKDNDEAAKEIAQNGQKFARENLTSAEIFCYHAVLFKEYARRLMSRVEVRPGMELVSQPEHACPCHEHHSSAKIEL